MTQALQSNQSSTLARYPEPTACRQGAPLCAHEAQLAVPWSGGSAYGIGERREFCRREVVTGKAHTVCTGTPLKKRATRHVSRGLISLMLLVPSYSWSQ